MTPTQATINLILAAMNLILFFMYIKRKDSVKYWNLAIAIGLFFISFGWFLGYFHK